MPKKIVCVHLLNDYSGSPLIFATIIQGLRKAGQEVVLLTGRGREGFLSGMDVEYRYFYYRFMENKYLRLAVFTWSQLLVFAKILRYWRQDVVVYVNTLLPFGAAIAGKLMGKKVIYHIHEVSINPPSLKRLLKAVAQRTAHHAVYVSQTLQAMEALPNVAGSVVYNGLSERFLAQSQPQPRSERLAMGFTVLMLCSLKDYKGVREFVALAAQCSAYRFELVVNSGEADIAAYFGGATLPTNLTVYPTQKNVHPFYRRANVVVNLSHPDRWVETFGMTILEAMHYGIPTIVPPVGGPTELVAEGVNGFLRSYTDLEAIVVCLHQLASDPALCRRLSEAAQTKAATFSSQTMIKAVINLLGGAAEKER